MKSFLICVLLASSASAGEVAVLSTGARMRVDGHENDGTMMRLHTENGTTELPADSVVRFEADEPMRIPGPPLIIVPPLQPRTQTTALRKVVDPHALIRAPAKKHRVPEAFVKSIMAAESNFNPEAVSPKGAVGLMQLMPPTARLFGADPNNPEQNVDAGTRYLRVLMDKYRHYRDMLRRVIAAYNAGPAMVDRYHGVPPFRETRTYVARVLGFLKQFQREGV